MTCVNTRLCLSNWCPLPVKEKLIFSLGCRIEAAGVGTTGFPCCPSANITGHDQCAAGTGCHQFLLAGICLCTSTCLEDRAIWGKLTSPKPPENSGECSVCSVGWMCPSLPYILHMQHVSLLTMQRRELAACSFRFAFCSHALFMSSFQLWSERPLSTGLGKLKHMQKPIACSHFFSFCSKPDDPITIILSYLNGSLPPVRDGQSAALHLPLSLGSRQLQRNHLFFHLFFEHSTWLSGLREQLLENKPFHGIECASPFYLTRLQKDD